MNIVILIEEIKIDIKMMNIEMLRLKNINKYRIYNLICFWR